MTRVLPVLILALVLGSGAQQASGQTADDVVATITEAAERHGVSAARLVQVARCESRFVVTAVGRAGEQGVFQLHPQGLGRTFRTMGYADPFNVWEASDFTAWAFANGLSSHWSCAR